MMSLFFLLKTVKRQVETLFHNETVMLGIR